MVIKPDDAWCGEAWMVKARQTKTGFITGSVGNVMVCDQHVD